MILKNINHIGIVVKDMEKAKGELSGLLGLECREQVELEEIGVKIATYFLGRDEIELLQFERPIDGVDPMVIKPRSGVQHVAFEVKDINTAVEELEKRGMRLVKGFPRKGAHGEVAFFHPTEALDLLIEICQPTASEEPRTKGR